MKRPEDTQRRGRFIGLMIAAIGVFWVLATEIGGQYGWSQRTRAFFDLAALAGFGMAMWMIYGLWRDRRKDKD